ncbi:DUF4129 domain-containing protein [Saccharibacillus kuerlensis]|uniref:DUF4129 domain-containing protein n=1 Tax=Saccharibacillus kuerlensis TaxID=459527 RepID=A0ABQ2KSX6_9BACL|nr:DUF4129 domain-containing protein [Saccharibacillus kuerlensis]GGN92420.1 hypothetical protein GCM10010969_04960 [Saccharibacillus kuerlensis]
MKTMEKEPIRPPMLQGLGRPAAYSLLETLSVYSAVVLLAHYILQLPDLLLLFPLFVLHAAASLIGLRQAQRRMGSWPTLLPFAFGILIALLIPAGLLIRGAAAAALLLAALRGLLTGRRQLWDNMQLRIPLSGLGAMLILYVVAGRTAELSTYRPFLYMIAVLLLALTLLLINGDRVRNAAGQETSSLGGVLMMNRRLTWMVALLVVVVGIIGGPTGILGAIREWWLSIFSNTGGQPIPEIPNMPAVDYSAIQALGEEGGETPLWLKRVGLILQILFTLVIASVILWLLYRLFGRWLPNGLRNLIRKIATRLGLMREIRASQEGKDYTDRAEKLTAEQAGTKKRRFRPFRRAAEYTGEDPKLRYRSIILHAARRGFLFKASRTPAENGRELSGGRYTELSSAELEKLVERYNDARYRSGKEKERE